MERQFPVPHEPFDGSAEDSPIVKFWYALLSDCLKRGHQKIHVLPPDSTVFSVRAFSDGSWLQIVEPPAPMYRAFMRRLKVMANLNLVRRVPEEEGRFRFAAGPSVFEVKVTMRIGPDGREEAMIDLPTRSVSSHGSGT
jgi:type II secretory ATPase GspE/PulE/Tfp pilus assembly ATPase PilB-like protein